MDDIGQFPKEGYCCEVCLWDMQVTATNDLYFRKQQGDWPPHIYWIPLCEKHSKGFRNLNNPKKMVKIPAAKRRALRIAAALLLFAFSAHAQTQVRAVINGKDTLITAGMVEYENLQVGLKGSYTFMTDTAQVQRIYRFGGWIRVYSMPGNSTLAMRVTFTDYTGYTWTRQVGIATTLGMFAFWEITAPVKLGTAIKFAVVYAGGGQTLYDSEVIAHN
jgi:hypothetical protein